MATDYKHCGCKYDLDQVIRAIRVSALPDDFAEYLATGGMPRPVETAADAD